MYTENPYNTSQYGWLFTVNAVLFIFANVSILCLIITQEMMIKWPET